MLKKVLLFFQKNLKISKKTYNYLTNKRLWFTFGKDCFPTSITKAKVS